MFLTREVRKTLEEYRRRRDSPPSVCSMMAAAFPHHLVMLVVFSAAAYLAFEQEIPVVPGIVIGIAVGAVSRDIGYYRRIARLWPTLSQVIAWNKLDEYLAEDANN